MYILAIQGSPRLGGNTDILLDRVLDGVRQERGIIEKVNLADLSYSACLECDTIRDDGRCKIKDGMQLIYEKVEACDAIIVASPVFFGSLSAQMKMMIDRFQCVWIARKIHKLDIFSKPKRGCFISVQASGKQEYFDNARAIVKNFFSVVSASYFGDVLCYGVDEKGDVLKNNECLKQAYELGVRLEG